MPDATPAPTGPQPQPHCSECAKEGHPHGDARYGMAQVRAAYFEGRARAAHRRARVLAHPDIAVALTEPPLRYSTADKWEGHIPPKWTPTKSGWKPNLSPVRSTLITICEFVAAREEQAESAEPEGEGVA